MAKRRNGRYTLTSRRRAALHKAQQASARKRRSIRNKRVVAGVGLAAGILAVSAGSRYATKVVRGGPQQRPTGPKQITVHGTTRTEIGRVRRPKRNVTIHPYSRSGRGKIISVSPGGVSTITRFNSDRTKAEEKKNYRRRRNYWGSKPVGGAPRKNARATPQVRMAAKDRERIINKLIQRDRRLAQQEQIKNVVSLDSRRGRKKK